ncbi:DUF4260 domain-containing protein [Aquimarina sp. 2201CG14-23]|uniref:DUF4260 domain-containing protein n=1 Tax=Aquimarina mycalae TaxID=3040073 RepID=UPI002478267E|nr:DUF4260 domain-containing protein [Aquimarina sp. 2201CG14-23]MDH7448011.1 DUF4260 domain-containing protein [Aquimarina sp. 2201CG14-23]
MKITLQLEEIAMLGLGIYLFSLLSFSWWLFIILFLVPDIGMLGYLIDTRIGALCYNILHHKGLAILIYFIGLYVSNEILLLAGVILFSHAAFDRILGYGLKLEKGFNFTHLGEIGKKN